MTAKVYDLQNSGGNEYSTQSVNEMLYDTDPTVSVSTLAFPRDPLQIGIEELSPKPPKEVPYETVLPVSGVIPIQSPGGVVKSGSITAADPEGAPVDTSGSIVDQVKATELWYWLLVIIAAIIIVKILK